MVVCLDRWYFYGIHPYYANRYLGASSLEMKSFRCSELDRVLACPGSATLVAMVAPRQGAEGNEGTALHWIAHKRMLDELAAVGPADFTMPPIPKSVAVSGWISDYYFNHVQDTAPADWSLQVECEIAEDFGGFTLTGHIDSVAISLDATEAIGFDLKTGYDPVDPAEENWQILGYAVLLLTAYPALKKITFYIVQPRNDEDEGFQRVSSVVLEGATLANAPTSLKQAIDASMARADEVETGRKQCKWCSAATQCPAAIALKDLMKAKLTPEFLATVKAVPDDAVLGDWVIAARSLARPMEDATTLLKERIKANGHATAADGTVITIKEEGGSYSFPDPGAFYRATREIITDDDKYAQTVKPSTTKTREVIADVMGIPKTSKKGVSAQSVFDDRLKPLTVQGVREKLVFA